MLLLKAPQSLGLTQILAGLYGAASNCLPAHSRPLSLTFMFQESVGRAAELRVGTRGSDSERMNLHDGCLQFHS